MEREEFRTSGTSPDWDSAVDHSVECKKCFSHKCSILVFLSGIVYSV